MPRRAPSGSPLRRCSRGVPHSIADARDLAHLLPGVIAGDSSAPPEVLAYLAKSQQSSVLKPLCGNPSFPTSSLFELVGRLPVWCLYMALGRTDLTEECLTYMVACEVLSSADLGEALYAYPGLPKRLFARLVPARGALHGRPHLSKACPLEVLLPEALAEDTSLVVDLHLSGHPLVETLRALSVNWEGTLQELFHAAEILGGSAALIPGGARVSA